VTTARIENVVTHGVFELDGGSWEVDNNVWLVGTSEHVLVIDAAHDAEAILAGIAGREVTAIVCTHGHNDHINAAGALRDAVGAPVWLHPDDRMLWDAVYPDAGPDRELAHGDAFDLGGVTLTALHTPGHSPGSTCLYSADLGAVFTGDTLFKGGPGATGRSYSDFPTILRSIESQLLTLPLGTVVRTGHGDPTTIGAEAPHLEVWRSRGH
jgi:glyoxylase-like metal-dependent hydrolase (beta-lactamase superfamily II)